jgi:hypothetical protein
VDPVPDLPLLRKSGSAGDRTETSGLQPGTPSLKTASVVRATRKKKGNNIKNMRGREIEEKTRKQERNR